MTVLHHITVCLVISQYLFLFIVVKSAFVIMHLDLREIIDEVSHDIHLTEICKYGQAIVWSVYLLSLHLKDTLKQFFMILKGTRILKPILFNAFPFKNKE